MPKRKGTTAEASQAQADETVNHDTNGGDDYQAGVDFDAESAEADDNFGEATGGDDPFFARFVVPAKLAENSVAREFHGSDVVNFIVTRWKKNDYTAQCFVGTGDAAQSFKGKQSRNPSKAIRNTIAAMGRNEKEYEQHAADVEKEQAPMPEGAGDNQPPSFFFEDTTEGVGKELYDNVTVPLAAVEESYKAADANTRAAERGIGSAYNAARAIFAREGFTAIGEKGDDEATKRGNTAWAHWLSRNFKAMPHVFEVMTTPGKRSRCGFYASAPDAVVEAMPTVNTATTFERKVNEAVSGVANAKDRPGFAASAIEVLFGEKHADTEEGEKPTATVRELWEAAVLKHESNLDKVAKARTKWEAEVEKARAAGNSSPAFPEQLAHVENLIIGWLLGDVSPTTEEGRAERAAAFDGSKLHVAMRGEWEAMANKPSAEQAAEQDREATKKRTADAAKEQSKGIALMSVSEAVQVVANTIMAHPEPLQIAEALVEEIKARQEAAKAKAAAAQAEADKQAAAAE